MGCSSAKEIFIEPNSNQEQSEKRNRIYINQTIKCKPMLHDYNLKFPAQTNIDLNQMKKQSTPLVIPNQQIDLESPLSIDTVFEESPSINRSNQKQSPQKGILKSYYSQSHSLQSQQSQGKRVRFCKAKAQSLSKSGFQSPNIKSIQSIKSHKITMRMLEASF